MKNLKLALTLSICALAIACSDDPADNNGTSQTTGTTATTSGTTGDTTGTTGGTTTTTTGTTTTGTTGGGTIVDSETACEGADAPARCTADAAGFVWGTASVLTELVIASDDSCCFDYNNDGDFNNVLGTTLQDLGQLASVNTSIVENLASGELAPILEHDGLTALDADGNFTVNFFLGSHDDANFTAVDPAGGNKVLINPDSIDAGTQPLAFLPDASLVAATGKVKAGPGAIALDFNLLGTELNLVISNAIIEADAVPAQSSIGAQGVALTNGKLGGLVKASDVFAAVNNIAATCGCLELGAGVPLIDEAGVCNSDAVDREQACTDNGEDTCASIAGACNNLGLVALLVDAESTPGAGNDSLSLGATIEAVGAEITGLE